MGPDRRCSEVTDYSLYRTPANDRHARNINHASPTRAPSTLSHLFLHPQAPPVVPPPPAFPRHYSLPWSHATSWESSITAEHAGLHQVEARGKNGLKQAALPCIWRWTRLTQKILLSFQSRKLEIWFLCRQTHANLNRLATLVWKALVSLATGIHGFWKNINSHVSCK